VIATFLKVLLLFCAPGPAILSKLPELGLYSAPGSRASVGGILACSRKSYFRRLSDRTGPVLCGIRQQRLRTVLFLVTYTLYKL